MDQYQTYFHHQETGSTTGIIFAIYTIGSMVGAVFTGAVCDNLGRRAGMAIGAVIIVTGAIVVTAAKNDSFSDWASR
jgi:MFS family permease